MTPVTYSVAKRRFDPDTDLPAEHRFAVVVPVALDEGRDYLLLRTRSNGQTFPLVYRTDSHARRGLTAARLWFADAHLWRKP